MTDANSNLIKYKNINLVTYLNEKFPTSEQAVLQMEKDKISLIKSNMETEIFKVFLQNSDSLLDILYSYESVYTKLQDLKDITYHTSFVNEKVVNVNKKKLKNFKGVLRNFTTDLSNFDTGERVLEYFDFVGDFIFLLTNDILIIGKKVGRKYTLVNTFNYSIIDMEVNDKLVIRMGETEMFFDGEKDKLLLITEKFKKLGYNYEDSIPSEVKINNDDESLKEYLIKTEKYDELIKKGMTLKITECGNIYDLSTLQKLTNQNSNLLISFFKNRFKEHLHLINKCKPLCDIIDDVFSYFYKFIDEEQEIYKEINIKILLLLEDHILECIKYFEKRIFSRRFHSVTLEEVFDKLKSKLKFKDFDFSYMVDYFTDKMNEQNEKYYEKAKEEIRCIIKEFLN